MGKGNPKGKEGNKGKNGEKMSARIHGGVWAAATSPGYQYKALLCGIKYIHFFSLFTAHLSFLELALSPMACLPHHQPLGGLGDGPDTLT